MKGLQFRIFKTVKKLGILSFLPNPPPPPRSIFIENFTSLPFCANFGKPHPPFNKGGGSSHYVLSAKTKTNSQIRERADSETATLWVKRQKFWFIFQLQNVLVYLTKSEFHVKLNKIFAKRRGVCRLVIVAKFHFNCREICFN